ncbi:hypothetical protein PM082_012385 [Marasmius tenuissimus]|nr:hypothetical protein PM082_012385 [Marasmius tenuissimus]
MPARRSREPVQQHVAKVAQSGKWTEEEDERLLMGIQQYGDDWLSISSKSVRTRSASQCSSRCGRVWSPEEDISLKRGYNDHGAKWSLISKLYVRSRSAELSGGSSAMRDWPPISILNDRPPVVDDAESPTQEVTGPSQCYARNTTQALGICSLHANTPEDVRATAGDSATWKSLALDVSFTELDLCTLGELGLITPLPTETLTTFRQREAENLVKLARGLSDMQKSQDLEQRSISRQVEEHARRLDEIHKTWNCEQKAVLERVEKHAHMFEDGFSQLKGIQQTLNVLSRQPVPAIPEEKLECLTTAMNSSLNRIRALEVALSRLQGLFEAQARTNNSVPMTSVPPNPHSQPFAHSPGRGHTQPQATQKPRYVTSNLPQSHQCAFLGSDTPTYQPPSQSQTPRSESNRYVPPHARPAPQHQAPPHFPHHPHPHQYPLPRHQQHNHPLPHPQHPFLNTEHLSQRNTSFYSTQSEAQTYSAPGLNFVYNVPRPHP